MAEAFICKAFKGEVVLLLLQALNNEADGSLRLAHRVKIIENKIDNNPKYLNFKTNFSLIFMQDLGSNLIQHRAIRLENSEKCV